jgi:Mn2+/Fe2+ NRAMP family transporter
VIDAGVATHSASPLSTHQSAVINGIISVPIMALMMLMAVRPEIMGQFVITLRLKILGWVSTGAMTLAVITMF